MSSATTDFVHVTPGTVSSETKPATKTTELIVYVVTVLAVLVASAIADGFEAEQAWLFVTVLTVGYLLSRGLAKSGSSFKRSE